VIEEDDVPKDVKADLVISRSRRGLLLSALAGEIEVRQ